jgi:hypothetical protein
MLANMRCLIICPINIAEAYFVCKAHARKITAGVPMGKSFEVCNWGVIIKVKILRYIILILLI